MELAAAVSLLKRGNRIISTIISKEMSFWLLQEKLLPALKRQL